MLGSHLSIAGGMHNALLEAQRLGMDCLQVFTKNQRQWRAQPLGDDEVAMWRSTLRSLGWHTRSAGHRVVSHNAYLINLASPDAALWSRSIALQRVEVERCETLGIPLVVAHPGAHLGPARRAGERHQLGAEPTEHELAGLKRIVAALDQIHRDLPGYRTVTCIETTVGSGSNLGYDFAHLRFIHEHVAEPERIGFCLDTCHVTAAGYDMRTPTKAAAVLEAFDRICGLKHLKVVHLNDSVGEAGSRLDRHAHIGHGRCGAACFRAVLNHPRLGGVPKVLETPKEEDARGRSWDLANLRRLRRLLSPPPGVGHARRRPIRVAG